MRTYSMYRTHSAKSAGGDTKPRVFESRFPVLSLSSCVSRKSEEVEGRLGHDNSADTQQKTPKRSIDVRLCTMHTLHTYSTYIHMYICTLVWVNVEIMIAQSSRELRTGLSYRSQGRCETNESVPTDSAIAMEDLIRHQSLFSLWSQRAGQWWPVLLRTRSHCRCRWGPGGCQAIDRTSWRSRRLSLSHQGEESQVSRTHLEAGLVPRGRVARGGRLSGQADH